MTGDPMMHPDRTEPREHCIGCGHPITGETCTECGGAVADGVLLKQASRNLGWIIALLAIAWGIDIAAFLAVNPFLPGMLSLSMISLLMFLSSILHAAGLILTAIVCLLLLTTRGWRPSDAWRTALWGLVVMLPLLSGTNVLIALAGLFTDRADLGLWVVLTPMLEAIGLVVLVTAIGACSLRTPGGGDRWFLSRAWIALGAHGDR